MGLAALEPGDADAAVEHFRTAAAADPSGIALWMNLAKAQRLARDDDAERGALEQALAIDQLHLMALIRLAELHERRGEMGSATDRWTMVLGLCAQIPNPTPELNAMISQAQGFVAERQQALAQAIDAKLADAIGAASERDRRRASAAVDLMLGRRKTFSNQFHGFFYPFLPADEFFDRDHFPWLARLEAASAVIREELETILAPRPGTCPLYRDAPRDSGESVERP